MAMYVGVTSARAVCKPCSSPSLSRSSSTNKLVRRRGRGSLVRSRAFIWSKEDLKKFHELAKRPRHEVVPDVVDHYTLTKSPSATPSLDNSASTDLDDMHDRTDTTFVGAVDQHPNQVETSPSEDDPPFRSLNQSIIPPSQLSKPTVTTNKPPLQHTHHWPHTLSDRPPKPQLPALSHHPVTPQPSPTNPHNLALVSGIAARLIDLTL